MKISRYILPILATAWIGSVSSRPFGDTLRMRDFGAIVFLDGVLNCLREFLYINRFKLVHHCNDFNI